MKVNIIFLEARKTYVSVRVVEEAILVVKNTSNTQPPSSLLLLVMGVVL